MPVTTFTTGAISGNFTIAGDTEKTFGCSVTGTAYPATRHRVTGATLTFSSVTEYSSGRSFYGVAGGSAIGYYFVSFTNSTNESPHSKAISCPTGTYEAYKGYYGTSSLGIKGNGAGAGTPISLRSGCVISLSITWEYTYSSCTPPTALAVTSTLAEGTVALKGSGAGAGNESSISGYEVQYCDSSNGTSWGNWVHFANASTKNTYFEVVAPPPDTRGYYRKFRARTLSSAGSSYNSGWKESTNKLQRNRLPNKISALNVSATVFESGNITVSWANPGDPDGNYSHQQIQYSVNGDTYWRVVGAGTYTGTSAVDTPVLQRESYIQYRSRSVDKLGATSDWVYSSLVYRNRLPENPTGLNVSPTLYQSGGITLTWNIPKDPDSNYSHQRIQYQIGSGTWTALGTYTGTSTKHYPGLNPGATIRYRTISVDKLGAEGSSWVYSAYVTKNTPPSTPTANYPKNNSTIYQKNIPYSLNIATEPNGQTMTLYYKQNGGTEKSLGTVTAGVKKGYIALENGTHTLGFYLKDSMGAVSGTVNLRITVSATGWGRTISSSAVISNSTISHKSEVKEMLDRINGIRGYVGLGSVTLPGTLGKWADWKAQMERLQQAVADAHRSYGNTVPTLLAVPTYPAANVINQIRDMIVGV